jgi:nitroreductase
MNHLKPAILAFILIAFASSCNNSTKQDAEPVDESKNQTLESILTRTSIREYSDKEISAEQINDLLKAGMAAPSSKDRRPWHFIVVSDKNTLNNLGGKLKNAAILKDANKAIVVCGDSILSDNCWFLDCSAATQNILLAAQSMGIGAVWTAVYPYEDRTDIVNDVFKLPENIKPLAIVPLGYPAGENTPKDKFDETRIHFDKW